MPAEFNGSKSSFIKVSVICSVYSTCSVFLIFVLTKYFVNGDTSYFSWQLISGVILFAFFYAVLHSYVMAQYDGMLSTGKEWKLVSTKVKLPETRDPKHFG